MLTVRLAILLALSSCGSSVCAGCGTDGGAPGGDPPDNFTARTNDGSPVCPRAFPIRDTNTAPTMFDTACSRTDASDGWTFACGSASVVGGPIDGSVTVALGDDLASGSVVVAYGGNRTSCNRTAPIDEVTIDE